MQLTSFRRNDAWVPGLLTDGKVVETNALLSLAGKDAVTSNRALLAAHLDDLSALAQLAVSHQKQLNEQGAVHAFDTLHIGPPIPNPEKIICIGLNYHDHAEEVCATPPNEPIFFAKYPNSLIGYRDEIIPPAETSKVDYEAELAIVIGKPGRYIREEDAMNHVAGAMVFNDVSARDLQLANQLWTGGKAIDTFGPCGPALHTMDEVGDLQDLGVTTRLNGDVLQDGTTANMIFSVSTIISFLSRIMTLSPGDIIATGTPAGVAASHDPARFMREGDVIEVFIEGLGQTKNVVTGPWRNG